LQTEQFNRNNNREQSN